MRSPYPLTIQFCLCLAIRPRFVIEPNDVPWNIYFPCPSELAWIVAVRIIDITRFSPSALSATACRNKNTDITLNGLGTLYHVLISLLISFGLRSHLFVLLKFKLQLFSPRPWPLTVVVPILMLLFISPGFPLAYEFGYRFTSHI